MYLNCLLVLKSSFLLKYSHFGFCSIPNTDFSLLSLAGRHFAMPSPHQVVVFSMECVGFSKALSAISSHSPPTLAGKILALEIGFYNLACFVLVLKGCIVWDSLFCLAFKKN